MSFLEMFGLKKNVNFDDLITKATSLSDEFEKYSEQAKENIETLEKAKADIQVEIDTRTANIERSARIVGKLTDLFS